MGLRNEMVKKILISSEKKPRLPRPALFFFTSSTYGLAGVGAALEGMAKAHPTMRCAPAKERGGMMLHSGPAPCQTDHINILSHQNVLLSTDFDNMRGFFCMKGMGYVYAIPSVVLYICPCI